MITPEQATAGRRVLYLVTDGSRLISCEAGVITTGRLVHPGTEVQGVHVLYDTQPEGAAGRLTRLADLYLEAQP